MINSLTLLDFAEKVKKKEACGFQHTDLCILFQNKKYLSNKQDEKGLNKYILTLQCIYFPRSIAHSKRNKTAEYLDKHTATIKQLCFKEQEGLAPPKLFHRGP